jgi:hypothetical protein
MRSMFRDLPLRSLRTAPTTPTRHHPPDTRLIPSKLRRRLDAGQPNIRRNRRRCRWSQQAWADLERKKHSSGGHEQQASLRPADSDTHPALSLRPSVVSPKSCR